MRTQFFILGLFVLKIGLVLEGLCSLGYLPIMGSLSLIAFHEYLDSVMAIGDRFWMLENGFCYFVRFSLRGYSLSRLVGI